VMARIGSRIEADTSPFDSRQGNSFCVPGGVRPDNCFRALTSGCRIPPKGVGAVLVAHLATRVSFGPSEALS